MCEAWLWNEGKLETHALLARRSGRCVVGASLWARRSGRGALRLRTFEQGDSVREHAPDLWRGEGRVQEERDDARGGRLRRRRVGRAELGHFPELARQQQQVVGLDPN